MSDLTDLAAKIDELTLADLVAAASRSNLPEAGGDYDTKEGWQKRMGVGRSACRAVIAALLQAGLAEMRAGQVKTSKGYSTVELVYSPTLAKKCG